MTYQDIIKAMAFVEFRDNGGKLRQASRKTGIPASTIYRWRSETWWGEMANNTNKHKGRRCVHQKPKCCRPSKLTPRVLEMVGVFFRDNESALQKDLYIYLSDHGIVVSKSSISRAIKLANFSRKRLSSHILGQQDVVKVGTFNDAIKPFLENPSTIIVSTDEMYVSEKVVPTHIYSKVGLKRGLTKIKSGGWKQRSLIQSIGSDGSQYHELVQGTVKRQRFQEYIERLPYPEGTVILMDNCTIHKHLEDVFNAKRFVPLYLSPYSPEFQAVEFAFSKIKGNFRHQYPWKEGIESAIETAVSSITSDNITQFFKHANDNLNNYTKTYELTITNTV